MEYNIIRPLVLESLKAKKKTQIIELVKDVGALATQKRIIDAERYYSSADMEQVREIINELIIEGIIGWGIDLTNNKSPHIKVTKHGEECLNNEGPQPYDPDGYLKFFKTEIPNVDETIEMYLSESLNAYRMGLMLSSTVMLGCASEKAYILLFEKYTNSLSDPRRKREFETGLNLPIKRKIDMLRSELLSLKQNRVLPKQLGDDIEIQLDAIINLIRNCRNDVGHPSGKKIDKRMAYANLQLFIPCCKRVYELIGYFNTNPF